MKIPTFANVLTLIKALGVRISIGLTFAGACLLLVYLAATDAGASLSESGQEMLIIAALVVIVVAIAGRTLTDMYGKRPSGEQPPPEDRSGE